MKNSNSTLFIISNIINRLGDSIDLIAMMWLTYEVTNSFLLTGVVAAFNGLPSIILGLFSGIITDHISKKKLILIGDVGRGIIVLMIAVLFQIGRLNIYILCLSTVLISTLEIFSSPARRSVLPFLVSKDDLRKENSKNSSGKIISQIIGLSLAGVIINYLGLVTAILIDGITFFSSAILVGKIKLDEEKKTRTKIKIFDDLKKGFLVIRNERIILETTIMATAVNLFIGGFNIMILAYCKEVLFNNSQGQSLINTLSVVGILVISSYFSYTKRVVNLEKTIRLGFYGLGISLLLFGICRNNIAAYLIAIFYGMATGCITVSSVTILHHNIPLQHMGKVMAIVGLTNESSIPLGNIIAASLLANVSVNTTFIYFGMGIVVVSSIILLAFKNCS